MASNNTNTHRGLEATVVHGVHIFSHPSHQVHTPRGLHLARLGPSWLTRSLAPFATPPAPRWTPADLARRQLGPPDRSATRRTPSLSGHSHDRAWPFGRVTGSADGGTAVPSRFKRRRPLVTSVIGFFLGRRHSLVESGGRVCDVPRDGVSAGLVSCFYAMWLAQQQMVSGTKKKAKKKNELETFNVCQGSPAR